MFGKLFSLGGIKILSPLSGKVIALKEVNDPVFSEGALGVGTAVKPDGGRITAPVDGVISLMFETGHAVSMTSKDGMEILIHVGLDTVKLKGRHFTRHAGTGDKVKAGDLLITFEREAIAAEGYDTVTPVVVCNPDDFKSIEVTASGTVKEQDEIIVVKK